MNFLTLAKKQSTGLRFTDRPVEPEKLTKILKAAQLAPMETAMENVRPVIVQSPDGLRRLAVGCDISDAPLCLVICVKENGAGHRRQMDIDASILAAHMRLQALELDLHTGLLSQFNVDIVADELNLPMEVQPVIVLTLGYGSHSGSPPGGEGRHQALALEDWILYDDDL